MTAPDTTASATQASPRPRLALWLGLAGLTAFLAVAALMIAGGDSPFTQAMDDAWRAAIGASSVDEVDGPLPMFFQYFGEGVGAIFIMLLSPIALFIVRRWRTALFWLASIMGSALVASQLVKHTVDRERPAADEAAGLFGPLFHTDHGSFPSGHSVTMGAFIVAVAALIPAAHRRLWWVAGVLLAVGMAWQRTLINAHYLSDTIAGLVAGASFVAIMWWAFAPLLEKDRGKPLTRKRS
ncbi:phosphatase PAP2 family protein [Demequina sp. NBRC 110056]|uniref:phosphatase PAP2 family protein n=1 Tax=Demequina sp. NBRC 110056 TaxID=1570345 RepID=UPI000A0148D4|nr:phosphatase PAP2 family protein [Demequina sp. NBRC 110056]